MNDTFLQLIRIGIGHPVGLIPTRNYWTAIKNQAEQHGLSAVALDGVDYLRSIGYKGDLPDKELTLQRIGEILHDYEQRNERCRKTR